MNLIFSALGPPGCGKTTAISVAAQLVENRVGASATVLSIGNVLRAIASGDITSEYSAEVSLASTLLADALPLNDSLVNRILEERLRLLATTDLVFLDGYPKYYRQVRSFEETMSAVKRSMPFALVFSIEDHVSRERIVSRGKRVGENAISPAFAARRVEEYRRESSPVEAFFDDQGRVRFVDASVEQDAICEQLVDHIVQHFSK